MSKAFVIDPTPTVRWPVTVRIPVEGGFEEWRFTGIFKVLPEEAFEAWDDVPEDAGRKLSEVLARGRSVLIPMARRRRSAASNTNLPPPPRQPGSPTRACSFPVPACLRSIRARRSRAT